MAERDAEVLQVPIGELGQDVGYDVVVAERLLVALQPQLAQPSRDVHVRIPPALAPERIVSADRIQFAMQIGCARRTGRMRSGIAPSAGPVP